MDIPNVTTPPDNGDSRTRTMNALTDFIATQRSLLARTQSDIGRLRALQGQLSTLVDSSESVSQAVATLGSTLRQNGYKLSNSLDCALVEPAIEWEAFSGHDPTIISERLNYLQATQYEPTPQKLSPLQALVKSARRTIADPVLRLYVAQQSEEGQEYPTNNPYLRPDPLTDDEEPEEVVPTAAEIKRQQERAKIHELKRRKLEEDQALALLPRRTRASTGIQVRKDIEDESAHVDIDLVMEPVDSRDVINEVGGKSWPPSVPGESFALARAVRARRPSGRQMEINIEKGKETNRRSICGIQHDSEDQDGNESETDSFSTAATATIGTASSSTLGKRSRSKGPTIIIPARKPKLLSSEARPDCVMDNRPSISIILSNNSTSARIRIKPRKQAPPPPTVQMVMSPLPMSDDEESDQDFASDSENDNDAENAENNPSPDPAAKPRNSSNIRRAMRPKPETYKERWSVSEQHLLEELLDKVGEGEKNRWLKISKAMQGRRTPRQVASRVQKYFSKLKRFGID